MPRPLPVAACEGRGSYFCRPRVPARPSAPCVATTSAFAPAPPASGAITRVPLGCRRAAIAATSPPPWPGVAAGCSRCGTITRSCASTASAGRCGRGWKRHQTAAAPRWPRDRSRAGCEPGHRLFQRRSPALSALGQRGAHVRHHDDQVAHADVVQAARERQQSAGCGCQNAASRPGWTWRAASNTTTASGRRPDLRQRGQQLRVQARRGGVEVLRHQHCSGAAARASSASSMAEPSAPPPPASQHPC